MMNIEFWQIYIYIIIIISILTRRATMKMKKSNLNYNFIHRQSLDFQEIGEERIILVSRLSTCLSINKSTIYRYNRSINQSIYIIGTAFLLY